MTNWMMMKKIPVVTMRFLRSRGRAALIKQHDGSVVGDELILDTHARELFFFLFFFYSLSLSLSFLCIHNRPYMHSHLFLFLEGVQGKTKKGKMEKKEREEIVIHYFPDGAHHPLC